MNRQTLIAGLIGLLVVGGLVTGALYYTRRNRVEVKGDVLKVRMHALDGSATAVVMDLRVVNPSVNEFVVREVTVEFIGSDGKGSDAPVFSEIDAQRLFDYYPMLGKKYNPSLMIRDKLQPNESMDRMIAVRVAAPEALVERRKDLRITVEDVDGTRSVIREKR